MAYLAPGVYVEEVPSAVKPIAGVGTSTAGFVGVSADIADTDMPAKAGGGNYKQAEQLNPQPINSWGEFTQKFGGVQAANEYLAHAVYGFFNNGGTRCWVMRVAIPRTSARRSINSRASTRSLSWRHPCRRTPRPRRSMTSSRNWSPTVS